MPLLFLMDFLVPLYGCMWVQPIVEELLELQESTRVKELIQIRHERMSATPFTFFRGAAIIQAHDIASTPGTVFRAQACGDAHISNFGIFASPERRVVFDINDFDETLPAPFEVDVKRLVASVEICGRRICNEWPACRGKAALYPDGGRYPARLAQP